MTREQLEARGLVLAEMTHQEATIASLRAQLEAAKAALRSIRSYAEAHDDEWVPFTVDEALAALEGKVTS